MWSSIKNKRPHGKLLVAAAEQSIVFSSKRVNSPMEDSGTAAGNWYGLFFMCGKAEQMSCVRRKSV